MGILSSAIGLAGMFGGGGSSATPTSFGSDQISNRQLIVPPSLNIGQLLQFASGPSANGGSGVSMPSRIVTPMTSQVYPQQSAGIDTTLIIVGIGMVGVLWLMKRKG